MGKTQSVKTVMENCVTGKEGAGYTLEAMDDPWQGFTAILETSKG